MTQPDDTAALVASHYLGNISENQDIAIQVSQAQQQRQCLTVSIGRNDCGKGRVFAQTDTGQSVGIVKGRDWRLRDGDVLRAQDGQLIVITLQKQLVIALQFERKAHNTPVNLMRLGHIIGNRHWPVTLRGETLYVEVAANADVVEATIREAMQTINIQGLHIVREFKMAAQALDFAADASANTSEAHSHHH